MFCIGCYTKSLFLDPAEPTNIREAYQIFVQLPSETLQNLYGFLQPYTAWQTNVRKRQTSKRKKPCKRNLKWKLYPVVLSIKPSTLVLAVNSWGMHVWLPHWSLMQSELIWDTPPTEETKKMDTRESSWFQNPARITSPQVEIDQTTLIFHIWFADSTNSEYWFSNL